MIVRINENTIEITAKDCDEFESFSALRLINKEELSNLIENTEIVYETKLNGNKVFTFKDSEELQKRWTALALSHKEKNKKFRESAKYLTTIKGRYCLIRDIANHTLSLVVRSGNWSYGNSLCISDKYAVMFIKDYNKTSHSGQEKTAKLYYEDSAYKKWSHFIDEKYVLGLKTYKYQVKTGEINPRTKEIHLVNDKYGVNTSRAK